MNFVYDDKTFSRAGILPFLPSEEAYELSNKINLTNNSQYVFSQNIRGAYSNWGKNISIPYYSRKKTTQSSSLRNLLTNFWSSIKPNNIFTDVNWEGIFCFEPCFLPYKQYLYNSIEGSVDRYQDCNIIQTAIRQTKNKARLVFSQEIFCEHYQENIKQQYNINSPIMYDICNDNCNTYSRYVILFAENVSFEECFDDFGKYILVNPIYKYLK